MRYLASISEIPLGDAGISATLDEMVRLARAGSHDPEVIAFAQDAVRWARDRDPDAEALAVLNAVRRQVRYTKDPTTAEAVKTPQALVREIQAHGRGTGDCDDMVTLTLSALLAVGVQAQPIVVSEDAGTYSHVLLRYRGASGWVTMDPITKQMPGWFPNWVKRVGVYENGQIVPMMKPKPAGSQAVVARPQVATIPWTHATTQQPAPQRALANLWQDPANANPLKNMSLTLGPYTDLLWWGWAAVAALAWNASRRKGA